MSAMFKSGGYKYYGYLRGDDTTDLINKYYRDQIKLPEDEAKDYRKQAFTNVERILAYINKADPRFSREVVRGDSCWRGLKVDRADDTSFRVVLEGLPSNYWRPCKQRYYGFVRSAGTKESNPVNAKDLDIVKLGIPLPDPPKCHTYLPSVGVTWSKHVDVTREGDIIPFLVKKQLRELLAEAITNLKLAGEVLLSTDTQGPEVNVYFRSGRKEIHVTLCPLVRIRLPLPTWMGWPRRARWPSRQKIERIQQTGVGLIANSDFYWMYSFEEAEKELVAGIDDDGSKRKQILRTMIKVCREGWCKNTGPVITSDIVKNIWFWELEKYPFTDAWDGEHLWTRLESMTKELLWTIKIRKVQQYFYPDNNLLQDKDPRQLDAVAANIRRFLEDPRPSLNYERESGTTMVLAMAKRDSIFDRWK